jgi:lysophospholipase L1-like esterase
VKDGEKRENVKLYLQSQSPADVTIYWGDIYSSNQKASGNGKPLLLSGHGLLYQLMEKYPRQRFANNVCRVVVDGADVTFHGIDGNVRPPTPEELAPVMMSYGTSITSGFNAGRADLQWNSLTARALGYDLVNLGSSGTAFCEKEMADYIAAQPWDLCTLEISVNMVTDYTVEEFRKRASYMIDTLAKSHPKAPIVCISIFPWGVGEYWTHKAAENTKAFRAALKEICESSGHKNVHYVHGPDLLSFSGLWHDMLHPSPQGMIEVAQKLAPKIEAILKSSASSAR